MADRPLVRVAYEFTCRMCGATESVRFPYNPLVQAPTVDQAIPEGWLLVLDGDASQSPAPMCKRERGQ